MSQTTQKEEPQHLCQIIDKVTGDVLQEYIIYARDFWFARHKASAQFLQDQQYQKSLRTDIAWYVDSCEI